MALETPHRPVFSRTVMSAGLLLLSHAAIYRSKIASQVRVSVEIHEAIAEKRESFFDCPQRADLARTVIAVCNGETEAIWPDALFDEFSEVPDAHNHTFGIRSCEKPKLVVDERLTSDFDQRLWLVASHLSEPSTRSASQDADGRQPPFRSGRHRRI